jgi:hypothetical protein
LGSRAKWRRIKLTSVVRLVIRGGGRNIQAELHCFVSGILLCITCFFLCFVYVELVAKRKEEKKVNFK